MGQLKVKNPAMANQIQNMINNGANPYGLLKQVVGGFDEQTRNNFFAQAEQFGFSKEYLQKVQNGINTL